MVGKNKDLRHNDAGARTSRCDFIEQGPPFLVETSLKRPHLFSSSRRGSTKVAWPVGSFCVEGNSLTMYAVFACITSGGRGSSAARVGIDKNAKKQVFHSTPVSRNSRV
jgi:hypothetical protein